MSPRARDRVHDQHHDGRTGVGDELRAYLAQIVTRERPLCRDIGHGPDRSRVHEQHDGGEDRQRQFDRDPVVPEEPHVEPSHDTRPVTSDAKHNGTIA